MMSSVSLISTAHSQTNIDPGSVVLEPGDPVIVPIGTEGPNGEVGPVVEYDSDTQTTTSTTYLNESVATNYSYSDEKTYTDEDGFGGQNVKRATTASATSSFTQRTATTTTSTPNGSGGFDVSDPVVGAPVKSSDTTVSNVAANETIATDITGMLSQRVTTLSSEGNTAKVAFDQGVVSTASIGYASGTGTATFDPETGEMSLAIDPDYAYTTMDAFGISTNGTVNAGTVVVEDDVIVRGESLVGKLDTLRGAIDTETAERKAADAELGQRIDTETAERKAADAALASKIDVVEFDSKQRDEGLSVRITEESRQRVAGDSALLDKLNAETTARVAADNAINARIDGLSGRVNLLETRVKEIDQKVDSSTALAIAMGGGGFLPDMKFNLSANVSTYNGAQAISASFGVRVSDNVAVTGAVGGGLNKGGKVGGRVGIIFGW